MYYLYYLSHPSSEVVYIGETNNLKRRLYAHIYESKRGDKGYRHSWIRKLLKQGFKPEMNILMSVNTLDECYFWEEVFIKYCKIRDIKICNLTNGGEGSSGKVFSKEAIEKISISAKATFKNKEKGLRDGYRKWAQNIPHEYKRNIAKKLLGNKYRCGKIPVNKGKRKLSEEQVSEIEGKLKNGLKLLDLAAEYKVSTSAISAIKNNKYFNTGWGNERSQFSYLAASEEIKNRKRLHKDLILA